MADSIEACFDLNGSNNIKLFWASAPSNRKVFLYLLRSHGPKSVILGVTRRIVKYRQRVHPSTYGNDSCSHFSASFEHLRSFFLFFAIYCAFLHYFAENYLTNISDIQRANASQANYRRRAPCLRVDRYTFQNSRMQKKGSYNAKRELFSEFKSYETSKPFCLQI